MPHVSSTGPTRLDERLSLRPIGIDDFSNLRHLHATSLRAQTLEVLSDEELAAFIRLVYSPVYTSLLMKEEVYGAWIDAELIGTVSWHAAGNSGSTASIGGIFVRHRRLGIGRRLLAEAEARAHQCGFERRLRLRNGQCGALLPAARLRAGVARRAVALGRMRAARDVREEAPAARTARDRCAQLMR